MKSESGTGVIDKRDNDLHAVQIMEGEKRKRQTVR